MPDRRQDTPGASYRLPPADSQWIRREMVVTFEFEGRRVSGYAGDTIASALYAAGVRTFSRSFKYHRPRGLLCVRGCCPNCLVQVDDTPNVRACTTPIRDGIKVRRQNAWPSADHDLLQVVETFSAMLPVGFYYKTFIRPRFMWPYYERVIRQIAGLGRLNLHADQPAYEYRRLDAGVAVVGGGLAGLSAAHAAASTGVDVVLIDDQPRVGGRQLACTGLAPAPDGTPMEGRLAATRWRAAVEGHPRVTVLSNATAFGLYEDNLIAVLHEDILIEVRAAGIVAATGTIEQPLMFENNDLPGVLLSDGARRLTHLYGLHPGMRVMVVGTGDDVAELARELQAAGVTVAAAVNAGPCVEGVAWNALQRAGVEVHAARAIREAFGRGRVEGAALVPADVGHTGEQRVPCDAIVMVGDHAPNDWLVGQNGRRLPGVEPAHAGAPTMEFAGRLAGWRLPSDTVATGLAAGARCAARIAGLPSPAMTDGAREPRVTGVLPPAAHPHRTYVCLCEDLTRHDLEYAIGEGFDDVELLKRYATVTMGPCQGRMCAHTSRLILAQRTGRKTDDVGMVTARPPAVPVPLAAFAGPRFMVEARSPLTRIHAQLGARTVRTGDWVRPDHYGDPVEEVRAARGRLGLIDVSTLGRVEVGGPDAPAFLERVYTGRFASLGVGRLRYGILCTDEGVIRDEGVVCRLAEDRFFLTTSTSGAAGTFRWLTWCRTLWNADVRLVDITAYYGAVNLAGPASRVALQPLADVDLGPAALPMLGAVEGRVAGVPCLIMRVGFVGELSYEIHFPSDYGEYLWSTLMRAGAGYGIRPFGVEAQKVLRLEKGHLIVGQDTDGLTDPFSAGLGWAVKLDKPSFIGKQSLRAIKSRGPRQRLVAFVLEEAAAAPVPPEGSQVVEGGRSVGRVTSCRFSPALSRVIGLASVPAESAQAGGEIQIHNGRGVVRGRIATDLYDPQGDRQKV